MDRSHRGPDAAVLRFHFAADRRYGVGLRGQGLDGECEETVTGIHVEHVVAVGEGERSVHRVVDAGVGLADPMVDLAGILADKVDGAVRTASVHDDVFDGGRLEGGDAFQGVLNFVDGIADDGDNRYDRSVLGPYCCGIRHGDSGRRIIPVAGNRV